MEDLARVDATNLSPDPRATHDWDHTASDFLSRMPASVRVRCPSVSSAASGRYSPTVDPDFRRDVLKLAVERDVATVDARTQPKVLEDAISRRADVPQFHPRPQLL
jgi:hypothetical protein